MVWREFKKLRLIPPIYWRNQRLTLAEFALNRTGPQWNKLASDARKHQNSGSLEPLYDF